MAIKTANYLRFSFDSCIKLKKIKTKILFSNIFKLINLKFINNLNPTHWTFFIRYSD